MVVGLQYRTWHNGGCGPSRQHTRPSGGHGLLCWRLLWIVCSSSQSIKYQILCHRIWLWWEPDRCTVGSSHAWSGWQKKKKWWKFVFASLVREVKKETVPCPGINFSPSIFLWWFAYPRHIFRWTQRTQVTRARGRLDRQMISTTSTSRSRIRTIIKNQLFNWIITCAGFDGF